MYDILDIYSKPYDEKNPVICVDEKSKELHDETRTPIPAKPKKGTQSSRRKLADYEYKRNGVQNIFVAVEPLAGKRRVEVTDRRTKKDFAEFIELLLKEDYKEADCIHIVLDNLNTHFEKSFIETFGIRKSKKILSRICFHYTPKHASWLDMAEIEINALSRQCLNRRIPTKDFLKSEVKAWVDQRNDDKIKIVWKFTKQDADTKLSKHYCKN